MTHRLKLSALPIILILLCFTGLFDSLYHATPLPAFEEEAGAYLADIRERATYAYAAARTLNGAISLLESVELDAMIISGQPGQVLEPVNDMVEQFSDLILIALASIGVQEILITVLGDISWGYLLPLALLPLALAPWVKQPWQKNLKSIGSILCLSVVFSRLLIPAIALSGQTISEHYLKPDYANAIEHVEEVKEKTRKAVSDGPSVSQLLPPEIITDKPKSIFSNTPAQAQSSTIVPNLETMTSLVKSDQIWTMLDTVPQKIITLITIFSFETIAWPILMVLLCFGLGKLALRLFRVRTYERV
ncbi:conserved exported hypothetical protein [Candidatus Terasakiella magnetica]|uniref:Uncharacterized protein n=1 Tax=Candidatus Terasakiella magnetica TaxID=1867952 RepID=A0A1C3RIN3_9PROT|nr:hypothetical protein [Candidatus Terasakiella magnetica]SCA57054.1 conserved exported hypothetical protein [Candidatus Terasakiella magnetica]